MCLILGVVSWCWIVLTSIAMVPTARPDLCFRILCIDKNEFDLIWKHKFPEFYFNKNLTGKPKLCFCFLSHQMQIVHTIIFGGGENVSDFICDANELISGICMVRYRVRDLTNQSQGGGRGPHGVEWEPPQPDVARPDRWGTSVRMAASRAEPPIASWSPWQR